MNEIILGSSWQGFLLRLLGTNTQSPLETGRLSDIQLAQELVAARAAEMGLEVAHFAPPNESDLAGDLVPLTVRETVEKLGPGFAMTQPNLVLRAGRPQPMPRTLVFNFHIDTVAGWWEPVLRNGQFVGRGAVDAKGPAVAVLAGVAHALKEAPEILSNTQILIQSVAGEEGGAMGIYGTKALIDRGFVGGLNVFAEPTGGKTYFDTATSTMTARVEVRGEGATDDAPSQGDNATVLLASVCRSMALALADALPNRACRMCVGGVHTGPMHNRVYGAGALHLNFAYPDRESARRIEMLVERSYREAMQSFAQEFALQPLFTRTAERAAQISQLSWTKRGLPALNNYDAALEQLLKEAGVDRCPAQRAHEAFTCDAIWGQGPGRYAVVLGPGDLALNHAHAEGEFIAVEELERFARLVAEIVLRFAKAGNESRAQKGNA